MWPRDNVFMYPFEPFRLCMAEKEALGELKVLVMGPCAEEQLDKTLRLAAEHEQHIRGAES